MPNYDAMFEEYDEAIEAEESTIDETLDQSDDIEVHHRMGTLEARSVLELERIQSKSGHQAILKGNGEVGQISVSLGNRYKEYDIGALYVAELKLTPRQMTVYDIDEDDDGEQPSLQFDEDGVVIEDGVSEAAESPETPDEPKSYANAHTSVGEPYMDDSLL